MNQITSFIFPDDYSKTGVHGSIVSHPGPAQSEPAQVVGQQGDRPRPMAKWVHNFFLYSAKFFGFRDYHLGVSNLHMAD